MKKLGILFVGVTLVTFVGTFTSYAGDVKETKGEKMERQMWADIKARNWAAVESKIAPGFQSVHQDGARDREAEIKLIKGLNLGQYILSNFKVTQNGPVIIVTCSVAVEETIGGKRLSARPAARLSVWLKTDSGWQWITHANLKPLKN